MADTTKPADIPTATANGAAPTASSTHANGLNGTAAETGQLVPESQTTTISPLPAIGEGNTGASSLPEADKDGAPGADPASKPTSSAVPEADKNGSAVGAHGSTDANTGSNPFNSTSTDSAPTATENKDTAAPTGLVSEDKASAGLASESKPETVVPTSAPIEKEDVEMKDATPPPSLENAKPDTTTAPVSGIPEVVGATGAPMTTPALATPATTAVEATGTKRKADTAEAEEPATKKQKGAFSKALDKAKEAVKDVKDKAKPGRKPGKKAKKEAAPPPVGRTQRTTRSQARSSNE